MRLVVCAVRDRAVASFGNPFFVQAVGQALRSFADAVNEKAVNNASQIAQHPEDFDLFELGFFDPDTGLFTQDGPPRQIAVGKDVKNSLG